MLFVIDMQNDYIDSKKGKRYIKDSEDIVDGIIDKIGEPESKGEYIYYTSDIPIIKNEAIKRNFRKDNFKYNRMDKRKYDKCWW